MKIGVIGLGAIAPYFLDTLADDDHWHLAAVCDLDEAKLAPFAAQGVGTFRAHEDLLGSGLVEAVVVTLPNHLHAPVVRAALEADLHVCCEKPLTIESPDAHELARLARRTGRRLLTAFHRRYNRHVVRLAAEVATAGSPVAAVRAHYDENILEHTGGDRWYLDRDRCGGGCVIDNGPNALDAVQQVVGPLTLEDAELGDIRAGVEHCARLHLRTETGAPVLVALDWARPTGERKEIEVELADGRVLRADMLEGFEGFKSSLSHEYAGILADFRRTIELAGAPADAGPAIVDLVTEAYRAGRRREGRLRMTTKAELRATVVKRMFHSRPDRGMVLSPWSSRCVRPGDVHELVTTTGRPAGAGDAVDDAGFVGFAHFAGAGVVERGDVLWIGEDRIGTVLGFDECHAPNHLNIIVATDRLVTSADLDLAVGDPVVFREVVP